MCTIILLVLVTIKDSRVRDKTESLRHEVEVLQRENKELRQRIEELRSEKEVLEQLEEWLEKWDVEEFEATAYTLACGTGDGYTATMTRPQVQHTIAVDPEVVPLGSWVYIKDLGWRRAEDTGGAIRGQRIDIFMERRDRAMRWGRRQVTAIYMGVE